jgi:hypothetical protein
MRRKRNWILKRLVLGFAVAALVVPSAAIAAVDEGGAGQPNSSAEIAKNAYVPFVTDFPKYELASDVNGHYGLPLGTRTDYAGNDYARRNVVSADIENVRLQPRTTSTPEVVSAGFDWGDAGIGAGLVLGLVLIGGAAFYGTRYLGKPQTA